MTPQEINTGKSDAWLGTVVGAADNEGEWEVTPLIVEADGSEHPNVICGAASGIVPAEGDKVFVVTMRNNLDGEAVSRFFPPSDSSGVIVGVFTALAGYKFVGDFTFDGDVTITGTLSVTGRATVGNLTVAGTPYETHMHLAGALISAAPGNPVTGITGALSP